MYECVCACVALCVGVGGFGCGFVVVVGFGGVCFCGFSIEEYSEILVLFGALHKNMNVTHSARSVTFRRSDPCRYYYVTNLTPSPHFLQLTVTLSCVTLWLQCGQFWKLCQFIYIYSPQIIVAQFNRFQFTGVCKCFN